MDIYYNDYLNDYITIRDIPYKNWTGEIVNLALKKEPNIFYEMEISYAYQGIISKSVTDILKVMPRVYQNNQIANIAFSDDIVNNFKYIDEKYRTIDAYKMLSKENFQEYLLYIVNYHDIPDEYRNKQICLQMFYNNISKYVSEIPFEYRTIELYNFLAETNFCEYYTLIPEQYRTVKMYEELVATSPKDFIDIVPIEKRSTKMYEMLFNECGLPCLASIPSKYRTTNMYLSLIEYSPYEYITKVPKHLYTIDMAVKVVAINSNLINYIPENVKTKEFYDKLLKINFFRYLKIYPSEYYSNELVDIVANKIASNPMVIVTNMAINDLVIKKYPHLLNRFNIFYVNNYLKDLLYSIIDNKITILDIKNKYHISETRIIKVLDKIKLEDNDKYNRINKIIFNNNTKHYLSLEKDIINLSKIIKSLDSLKRNTLTLNKKIKIAYLTNVYLSNSLEEIYAYNNQHYQKIKVH